MERSNSLGGNDARGQVFLPLLTNERAHNTDWDLWYFKKQMAFETGYSPESISALVQRFTDHHKLIRYNAETREIAIKNWGKYNFNKGGKPVLDWVKSELKSVKDIELISYVGACVENEAIKKIYESYYDTCHESLDDTSTSRQNDEPKESQANNHAPSDDTSTIRTTTRGQEKKKKKKKNNNKKKWLRLLLKKYTFEKSIHSIFISKTDSVFYLPSYISKSKIRLRTYLTS